MRADGDDNSAVRNVICGQDRFRCGGGAQDQVGSPGGFACFRAAGLCPVVAVVEVVWLGAGNERKRELPVWEGGFYSRSMRAALRSGAENCDLSGAELSAAPLAFSRELSARKS